MPLDTTISLVDAPANQAQSFHGNNIGDRAGSSMAPTNTLDANGLPGFWVGARGVDTAYGVPGGSYGRNQNLTDTAIVTVTGTFGAAQFADNMVTCDIDGDGHDDVFWGTELFDGPAGSLSGAVWGLKGQAPGNYASNYDFPDVTNTPNAMAIFPLTAGERFGWDLACANLFGSSRPELIVVSANKNTDGAIYAFDGDNDFFGYANHTTNSLTRTEITGLTGQLLTNVKPLHFFKDPSDITHDLALSSYIAYGNKGYAFIWNVPTSPAVNATVPLATLSAQGVMLDNSASPGLTDMGFGLAAGKIDGGAKDALIIGGDEVRVLLSASLGQIINTTESLTTPTGFSIEGVRGQSAVHAQDIDGDGNTEIFTHFTASTDGLTDNGGVCIINGNEANRQDVYIAPTGCSHTVYGSRNESELGRAAMVNVGNIYGVGSPDAVALSEATADIGGELGVGQATVLRVPDFSIGSSSTTGVNSTSDASSKSSFLFSNNVDLTMMLSTLGAVGSLASSQLGPKATKEIEAGATSGAISGTARGVSTVLGLALSQYGLMDADAAQTSAKLFFYAAISLMTLAQTFAQTGDVMMSLGASVTTLVTMMLTELSLNLGRDAAHVGVDALHEDGWVSSSTANTLHSAADTTAKFGIHARTALTGGVLKTGVSVVVGNAMQYAVEEGSRTSGLVASNSK